MVNESIQTVVLLICMGGLGALTKEILVDNKLTMPKILNGEVFLGFIGSMIIGAIVGYLVDHSPITAFFSGYAGFSTLGALMAKSAEQSISFAPESQEIATNKEKTTEQITKKEGEKIEQNKEKKTTDNNFNIRKPFDGNFRITQKFGENPSWYKANGYDGHFGIDYATPYGTAILACDDGEVVRNDRTVGNGNFIEIKHKWGYSLYLHFKDKACKNIGQIVKRGEIIGYAGNTGDVKPAPTKDNKLAGTHLHFSIKVNGIISSEYKNFIDPTPFFESIV
jgi:murein DD-endopeptidase MepM/ murein hydrolase activator NlpD